MLEAIEVSGSTRRTLHGDLLRGGGGQSGARKSVVLCHGFGADANDLAPLAEALDVTGDDGGLRWLFPQAPYRFQMGWSEGRAWFPRDPAGIESFASPEILASLGAADPPTFGESTRELVEFLGGAGCEPSETVIGGFSQGAMVAAAAALEMSTLPAGLLLFSGSIIAEQRLSGLAGQRPGGLNGLPVAQFHGREDLVLPFESGQALAALLESAGASVTFIPFSGGHGIPQPVIEHARGHLAVMFDRG